MVHNLPAPSAALATTSCGTDASFGLLEELTMRSPTNSPHRSTLFRVRTATLRGLLLGASILGAGLTLVSSTSCNSVLLGGNNDCVEGTDCSKDPNNKSKDPKEMTSQVGGMGGTPFNPAGDDSTGVKLDPNGNVILDPNGPAGQSQSVIWVANSVEGTVSKIDTRTMKQLARYTTYPGSLGDPSRTTVSLGGDVVVANRAWQSGAVGSSASAVKIAGEKSACFDRNKNGKIDTFEGEGPVPAQFVWAAGMKESPDECVLWLTYLNTDAAGNAVAQSLPRAAGYDGEILDGVLSLYAYIGLYNNREVVRLDSRTGAIVKRFNVSPSAPYGLTLDKGGNVWILGAESGGPSLTRIDVRGGDKVTTYSGPKAPPCGYGITADARGLVYTAGGACVARFNPMTESWEQFNNPSGSSHRGLAIDMKNQLWVADTSIGMHHIDASAAPPAAGGASTMVYRRTINSAGSNVGAAIDFDNRPWVISQTSVATKIDPTTYGMTTVGTGNGPYTYSDMTGYQLRNASRAGIFRHTFAGCSQAMTTWTTLSFTVDTPMGSKVAIRYRGAPTVAELSSAPWQIVTEKSPVKISLPPTPPANFLQVEVSMTSIDTRNTPVLSSLSAAYTCKLVIG